ncbi:hypothetical protein GEMRC1_000264 [Eukaryota sp. GEM-RC1]
MSIFKAFEDSISSSSDASVRSQAEEFLNKTCFNDGFIPSSLELVANSQIPHPIRLAASLYVKNLVHRHWTTDSIPTTAKSSLKANIIPYIISLQDHQLRDIVGLCVTHMAAAEFPQNWPEAHQQILSNLQTFASSISPYLLSTLTVFKRERISDLIAHVLPGIFDLTQSILIEGIKDDLRGEIISVIFEIIFSINRVGLCQFFKDHLVLFQWYSACAFFLRSQFTSVDSKIVSKIQVSITHFISINLQRYAAPSSDEFKSISVYVLGLFSGAIPPEHLKFENLKFLLGSSLTEAVLYCLFNQKVNDEALCNLLEILDRLLLFKNCWERIKPSFSSLFTTVLFPLLKFRESDIELFNDDPLEFIKITTNQWDLTSSPSALAGNILITGIKKRAKTVLPVVGSIVFGSSSDLHVLDGSLHIVSLLARRIQSGKITLPNGVSVYAYLSQKVLPIIVGENLPNFLIFRALGVLKSFSATIQNLGSLENIEKLILKLGEFLSHTSAPIQLESALVLRNFLSNHDEQCEATIMNCLKRFLEQFLNSLFVVLDDIGAVDVTETINLIVTKFTADCSSLMEAIVLRLITSFENILSNSGCSLQSLCHINMNDHVTIEVSDDAESALLGVLRTIITVFDCNTDNTQLFSKIAHPFSEFLLPLLNGHLFELFEPSLSLLSHLSATVDVPFSPNMWKLFDKTVDAFKNFALDYLPYMVIPLDNFITRDPEGFACRPQSIDAINVIISRIFNNEDILSGPEEKSAALKLLQSCFVNLSSLNSSLLSTIFPEVANICVHELLKTSPLRKQILNYRKNPNLTCSAAELDSPELELSIIVTFCCFFNWNSSTTVQFLSSFNGTTFSIIQESLQSIAPFSPTETQLLDAIVTEELRTYSSVLLYVLDSMWLSVDAFYSDFSRKIAVLALGKLVFVDNSFFQSSDYFSKSVLAMTKLLQKFMNHLQMLSLTLGNMKISIISLNLLMMMLMLKILMIVMTIT